MALTRRLCAALAVAALGTGCLVTQAAPAHAAPGPDKQLTRQQLAVPAESDGSPAAAYVGVLAPTTPLVVDVTIDSQLAAKQAAVTAIYTPGSATYHRYYSNATWDAQWSVPQSTYDAVVSRLTAAGLTVRYSDETRDLVELSGTAASVATDFGVVEQQWKLRDSGRVYYVNDRAPTVPGDVDAVQGLTDVGWVLKGRATDQTLCAPDPAGGNQCAGALEASELATIYGVSATGQGAGQALAVFGDGDTQGPTADLHKYESDRHLPQVNTVFVNTSGDSCVASGPQASGCDTANEGEWALDGDSSTAIAPNVRTLYYFFPSQIADASGVQGWADYNSTASGPIPMQMNASFGECETFGLNIIPIVGGEMGTYTNALVDAAGKGKTMFVSAGDVGGGCILRGVNGVTPGGPPQSEFPCTSQWVVCVGGTALYTNGATDRTEARANLGGTCTPATTVNQLNQCGEVAWSHTGGGTSYYLPAQSWQQALSPFPIVADCLFDPDGTPYTTPTVCRGVPDVAAFSGDITVIGGGNGMNDVEGGTPATASSAATPGSETEDGGTSLSAPLWEGMWADIESSSPAVAGAPGAPLPTVPPLGFAAPLLYNVASNPTNDSCAFYDVQVDQSAQSFPYPPLPRSAADATGWDYVSGLGAPQLGCLAQILWQPQGGTVPEAPWQPALPLAALTLAGVVALRRRGHATA